MLVRLALMLACQSIEPVPSSTEVGREVRIEALNADRTALSGLTIEIRWPDGRSESLGATDAEGRCSFVPTEVGAYRVAATLGSVRLLAPLHAREPRDRLWYALLGVPLGAALAWRHLSRRQPR